MLNKTSRKMSKGKIVIMACGSFSPPTYMHLRMFGKLSEIEREMRNYFAFFINFIAVNLNC